MAATIQLGWWRGWQVVPPLHGRGHTGLARGHLWLSSLINSEKTVKFLFPNFFRLCSSRRALPETCPPESAVGRVGWTSLFLQLSSRPPQCGTTRWLCKRGYTSLPPSLPIPSPHLQQTPPCFPSVLTTLSNCCGKAEADLQHLLLRLEGKQRQSAGRRHRLLQPLWETTSISRGHKEFQAQSMPQYITRGFPKGF